MLTNLRDITARDMLLDWGLAEAETRCAPHLAAGTLDRVVRRVPLTEEDRVSLILIIAQIRQPLLTFGIDPLTTWHAATMAWHNVGQIRLLRMMPAATISSLAASETPYALRAYSPEAVRGRPIMVGPSLSGPWNLLEGTHRLCGATNSGHHVPVEVIVGVCPTVEQWAYWRG